MMIMGGRIYTLKHTKFDSEYMEKICSPGGMMSRKPSQFDTLPCMETGYGMHIPSAPGSK